MNDLYNILGVSETASADEIKSAYRKLAVKYHPDKNQGDKNAEDKFKQINAAYDILGNEQKRKEYDLQRHVQFNPHQRMNTNFDINNIDEMFQAMFQQAGFGNFSFRRGPEKNRDVTLTMTISLEDAFHGKQVPMQINTPSGRRVELSVNIPAGVDSGMRIRYQGQGDQRNTSLPPGDLYIQVEIAPHDKFIRKQSVIETSIKVDAVSLILGCKKIITCIDGSIIDLAVPQGIQNGIKIRVPKKGMPVQPNSNQRGDMLVLVEVEIPLISDEKILEQLKDVQKFRGLDIH